MAITNDVISSLGLGAPEVQTASSAELGQEDFLRLLTTELRFQDPTEPLDSKEFLGQIAQFTSVDGIQGMQQLLEDMSATVVQSQMLQAAAVVGSSALAPVSETFLETQETVSGKVDLQFAVSDLEIVVRDGAGVEIAAIDLGTQQAGLVPFTWDGTVTGGGAASAGVYSLTARYTSGDSTLEQPVLLWQKIESISVGDAAGPLLNVDGGSALYMTDIIEFA